MYCRDCGKRINTWQEYCNRCGADLFDKENRKRTSEKHTLFERLFSSGKE